MICRGLSSATFASAILAAACASAPEGAALGSSGASGADAGATATGMAGSGQSGGSPGAAGMTNSAGSASGTLGFAGSAGGGGNATAGSAGSATAGAAGEAGATASASCPAGAVFCDDFEALTDMAPPAGKWASRTGGMATIVVDTAHAHSGTKAVHFHSASVDDRQRAYMLTQGAPGFPVVSDTLYVRFMLYIDRYISNGSSVHNRIAWVGSNAALAAGGGDGPGYMFVTYNGIAIERLETNHGFQRDTTQHMDDAGHAGKWQCFEFEIDNKGGVPTGEKASSTTRPHIWQDGVELKLSAAGTSDAWLPAPFEALQFSLWCPQADPQGTDYWIDDVAVSTARINCPAP